MFTGTMPKTCDPDNDYSEANVQLDLSVLQQFHHSYVFHYYTCF